MEVTFVLKSSINNTTEQMLFTAFIRDSAQMITCIELELRTYPFICLITWISKMNLLTELREVTYHNLHQMNPCLLQLVFRTQRNYFPSNSR